MEWWLLQCLTSFSEWSPFLCLLSFSGHVISRNASSLHPSGTPFFCASWYSLQDPPAWAPSYHSLKNRNDLVLCHSPCGGQISTLCQSLGKEHSLREHVHLPSRLAWACWHSLQDPYPWASYCPLTLTYSHLGMEPECFKLIKSCNLFRFRICFVLSSFWNHNLS